MEGQDIPLGTPPETIRGQSERLARRGRELRAQGRFLEALACFETALECDPGYARAYAGHGQTLIHLKRLGEAMQSFHQALRVQPHNPAVWNAVGQVHLLEARVEDSVASFREALRQEPRFLPAYSNLLFALHFDPCCSPESLFAEHQEFGRRFAHSGAPPEWPNPRDPERPLRIGYVSCDFYNHPVSHFFEPLLDYHLRDRFHVTCYANVQRPDAVTRRLLAKAARWRYIHSVDDQAVANRIRLDNIDILIDLCGHTGESRLNLFALRPAPVQITYLGYPDTTGMPSIQYRVTDSCADPPGLTERLHSEELLRLPRCFLCYRAPEDSPPVAPLPWVSNGTLTFGSFSKPAKWNRDVIDCWSVILSRLPQSRLLLHHGIGGLNQDVQARARAAFAGHGIDPGRITLTGNLSPRQHLELYGEVDLGLDPFPYNGTSAFCESLWMGVPSVALAGRTHVSRVGVGLLEAAGLGEFAARTLSDYVELAVALAGRPEYLATLRENLRDRMRQSPLMDGAAHVAALEGAYRTAWRRWCSDRVTRVI